MYWRFRKKMKFFGTLCSLPAFVVEHFLEMKAQGNNIKANIYLRVEHSRSSLLELKRMIAAKYYSKMGRTLPDRNVFGAKQWRGLG